MGTEDSEKQAAGRDAEVSERPGREGRKAAPERDMRKVVALSVAALGVVYGDIGTSPLYAFKVCFVGAHSVAATPSNILGVLSLIFWSLVIVISLKYVLVILRADNQGEGGILALMELVLPEKRRTGGFVLVLGLFGAALLYGDGTITPAISVLSAFEGLNVATPVLEPYVVPITLGVLVLLFLFQRRGSGAVGSAFGPVMLVWFPVLALLGILQIVREPAVLAALNPMRAVVFVADHGLQSAFLLGAVFLVVTGGEALYADIGHFGRPPIRNAWFVLVLPCLLLNYFGQGGLVMAHPGLVSNPFYHLAPAWALYPMVLLAAIATIIASQAIISGVFSLSFQAQQLGYLPRLRVQHTSEEQPGQIYMPQINWLLFAATAAVVLGFKSSGNLSGAYGLAVSTTMVITTLLAYRVFRFRWEWHPALAAAAAAFFLIIDLAFFGANIAKILEGGWYPLVVAAAVYVCMSTWSLGNRIVGREIASRTRAIRETIDELDYRSVRRVAGTAIYLSRGLPATPSAFVHNITHNKVVHRRVLFVAVEIEPRPHVRSENRIEFESLSDGFWTVKVRYGFMDNPNIPAALRIVSNHHLSLDFEELTYFVGRESLVPSRGHGMSLWRDKIFLFLRNGSQNIVSLFNLPDDRVIELGSRIRF